MVEIALRRRHDPARGRRPLRRRPGGAGAGRARYRRDRRRRGARRLRSGRHPRHPHQELRLEQSRSTWSRPRSTRCKQLRTPSEVERLRGVIAVMNLDDVHRGIQKHKKRKRVGRGPGSGHGKTCGRGHKGQGQRAGWSAPPDLRGRRRCRWSAGFPSAASTTAGPRRSPSSTSATWKSVFDAGDEVTPETLQAKNLAKGRFDVLKILGDGELTKKLKVSAHRFSTVGAGEDREGRRRGGRAARQDAGRCKEEARPQKRNCTNCGQRDVLSASSTDVAGTLRRHVATYGAAIAMKDGSSHVGKNSRRLHDPGTAAEDPADAAACWPSTASAGRSRCRSSTRRR